MTGLAFGRVRAGSRYNLFPIDFHLHNKPEVIMLRAIAVALTCAIGTAAIAHENPVDWIGQERRTNAENVLCCGEGDCHPLKAEEVKIVPGQGYQLPDGEIIPFNKAAPSADGFYWSCVWAGSRKCFFAPLGGV